MITNSFQSLPLKFAANVDRRQRSADDLNQAISFQFTAPDEMRYVEALLSSNRGGHVLDGQKTADGELKFTLGVPITVDDASALVRTLIQNTQNESQQEPLTDMDQFIKTYKTK